MSSDKEAQAFRMKVCKESIPFSKQKIFIKDMIKWILQESPNKHLKMEIPGTSLIKVYHPTKPHKIRVVFDCSA